VPPGKWGTNIVFWSKATKTEEDEDGGEVEKDIHFMRTYTVFNIDQIEGSGARPVDQEVVDYVEARIVEPIRRGSPQWTDQDLANVEALLRYLRTHLGTTAEDKDGSFHDSDLQTVTYGEVREAQPDPFSFSVVGDDAVAVAQVLAQGIDAHWEACFVEARGDRCTSHRVAQIATLNDQPVGMPLCGRNPRRLSLILSPMRLPVLLRRLFEHNFGGDKCMQDAARSFGRSILDCIRQPA
jgi:hypothetical protein